MISKVHRATTTSCPRPDLQPAGRALLLAPARTASPRRCGGPWRPGRTASTPIAFRTRSLSHAAADHASGRLKSTNSTTRVPSVSFHASCSHTSSNTRLLPSSQCRTSSPTRMPHSFAGSGTSSAEVVSQHALVRAAVRRDALVGRQDREHRRRHARGSRASSRAVSGHRSTLLPRGEAVAVEEERLPAVVLGDLVLVGGDVLEVRQVSWYCEHRVELRADRGYPASNFATQGKSPGSKKAWSPTSECRPKYRSSQRRNFSPTRFAVSTARSRSVWRGMSGLTSRRA